MPDSSRIIDTGPISDRARQKQLEQAIDAGLRAIARHWHKAMMPAHFTLEGGKRYGYQPRRGDGEPPYLERMTRWTVDEKHQRLIRVKNPAYSWRKRRDMRHNKPLVWTGLSEHAAKAVARITTRTIKGTGKPQARLSMPALPKYFYQYRTWQSRKEYRGWGSGTFQRDINTPHTSPDKWKELTTITPSEWAELERIGNAAFTAAMGPDSGAGSLFAAVNMART